MSGPGGVDLRVVSYNVHSLRDDRSALTEVVRELAPDVLLLQEAPRRFRWRQRCAALARSFGLVVAVGGLPAVGNLILTDLRVQVRQTWCLRFPLTPGRHLRGAALARCSVAGVDFVVAGSHLATWPPERPEQARLLAQALVEQPEPVVVGADLNDQPGSPTWQALADGRQDPGADAAAPTFSSTDPRRRIDAIFVDPRFEVLAYQVVDTPAARRACDHLPVVADLRVP
ncbi:MAG: endonuclease [Micromonosporaceae bacterium]|nr:endonuclease [Micromonosporaceae bacterium]